MSQNDIDFLFPVWEPKSFVWTVKNKYPRTTYNVDMRDWSRNPIREDENVYLNLVRPCLPPPPIKRFRPFPPMDEKKALELRLGFDNSRGRTTPAEALHWGYRRYSLDPTQKTLRHFNDPIPHPLDTVYRESYVAPADRPRLLYRQGCSRYAFSPHNESAVGIVPVVPFVDHYEPVIDRLENVVYQPKYEQKRKN